MKIMIIVTIIIALMFCMSVMILIIPQNKRGTLFGDIVINVRNPKRVEEGGTNPSDEISENGLLIHCSYLEDRGFFVEISSWLCGYNIDMIMLKYLLKHRHTLILGASQSPKT